jgi:tripartite-type tricarboxylate transporter receptor subunit TctC
MKTERIFPPQQATGNNQVREKERRKNMASISTIIGLIGLTICTAIPFSTFAETYPVKPIRIVVGFAPGGGTDLAARTIAKELAELLGRSVIVDNRPGAASNIAADLVAKSAPDGYTLHMSSSNIAIPSLFEKLPFNINKDFTPISLVAIGPAVLVAQPSFPANSVKELIALAKSKPGQLTYGSGGIGNITHLYMELLAAASGIQMIHVPYKGAAPSLVGLMSGEVNMLFSSLPSAMTQLKAGKVKPLGVTLKKRIGSLPNVPTIDESGLPGYDAASWYGLFAPAGIPKNVLGILGKEVVKIMRIQGVRDKFASDGFDPVGSSPEEFSAFLREEIPKWAKAVKAAGIKPQ